MKKTLLVSIASYGDSQRTYLNSILAEYCSYQNYAVTINVHTTIPFEQAGVNTILHDPTKSGRMTYLHRQEFIGNQDNYDLFIYTEDDMLIPESAVDTYVKYNEILPPNYCLGFIRYEEYPGDSNKYLLDQWPNSPYVASRELSINDGLYFSFTNLHQSSYLITREQLKIAIQRPGFARTDTPNNETASTGIFCGWSHSDGVLYKVHTRNLADLKKCLIHHLPDNHITKYNLPKSSFATWDLLVKDLNLI